MNLIEMFEDEHSMANMLNGEAETLAKSIAPDVKLDVFTKDREGATYMEISRIEIPKDQRMQGAGTRIMTALCDLADSKGVIMVLTPTSELGTPKTTLIRFYKSFGFVSNVGSKRDFAVRSTMIRYPKGYQRVSESLYDTLIIGNLLLT
jgi:predicted GNAT family N-acyltransferase